MRRGFDLPGRHEQHHGPGEFDTAQGIATDSSGNVYVVDTDNDRVEKFDSNGNFLSTFGSTGAAAGQLQQPVDVTVGTSGDVYVTDPANGRIDEFNSMGSFVQAWGKDVGVGRQFCDGSLTPCQSGIVGHAGRRVRQPEWASARMRAGTSTWRTWTTT